MRTKLIILLNLSILFAAAQAPMQFAYGDYTFFHSVNVNSGGSVATHASAAFEIKGTNKGFLPPRLTTTQRDAISSPATYLTIVNTTTGKYQYYNGSAWVDLFTSTESDPVWTAASANYYTQTQLQTSGSASVHWNNLTNKPTTLSGYGITDPVVLTSGSYANPSWLTSLAWSKITGTPTSLSGYGITDPVVLTSGSYSNPAWITSLAWSKITGTPTTLSGYGITDALSSGADLQAVTTNGHKTTTPIKLWDGTTVYVEIGRTVNPDGYIKFYNSTGNYGYYGYNGLTYQQGTYTHSLGLNTLTNNYTTLLPMANLKTMAVSVTANGSTTYAGTDGDIALTIPQVSSITLSTSGVLYSSPVTFTNTSGAWAGSLSLASQSAYKVLGTSGSSGTPSFQSLNLGYLSDVSAPTPSKGDLLYYNGTTWAKGNSTDRQQNQPNFFEDFQYPSPNRCSFDFTNSGTGSASGSCASIYTNGNTNADGWGAPSSVYFQTGTTAGGYSYIFQGASGTGNWADNYADGEVTFKWLSVGVRVLATSTDDYILIAGMAGNPTSTEPTSGNYFKYNRTESLNWQVCTSNVAVGGSRSCVISTTPVVAQTKYTLMGVLSTGGQLRGYINGTEIVASSGSYPITGANNVTTTERNPPIVIIRKTAGTTNVVANLDAFSENQVLTTSR